MGVNISGTVIMGTLGGPSPLNLSDLHDVNISNPQTGQYLRYNGATLDWQNSFLNTDVYNYLISSLSGTGGITITGLSGPETIEIGYTLTSGDITTALGYIPVNQAGDTMTGSLILNADPTDPLGAATKQYVDDNSSNLVGITDTVSTALGLYTLSSLVTGSNNTAIGFNTLASLQDGSNNIALGYGAGAAMINGNNNVIIGNYPANVFPSDDADNNIVIADGSGNVRMSVNAGGVVNFGGDVNVTGLLTASSNLNVTGLLSAGYFNGDGSAITNIPASAITGATTTIGTTSITLGGSSATLDGLSSVTSTTFVGALTGHASDDLSLSGGTMTGNLILNANPVSALGAATKQYVDSAIAGLSWKQSVVVATTANITLSGLQAIDGYTTLANDRVLVKNQTTATQNGIYVASSGAWTRSTDADTGAELVSATVYVDRGTVNADTGWTQTTNAPITIGSTNIAFVQFTGAGTYTAGSGLTLTGNTFSLTNNSLTIGSTSIALGATATTLAGLSSVTSTTFVGALTGNASSATTATTSTNIAGGTAGNVHYQSGAGTTAFVTNAAGVLQAATSGATPAWTTTPTLTGTNFTGIPNSALTNNSVTIGTTTVALGATTSTLAGLTSVTATSFNSTSTKRVKKAVKNLRKKYLSRFSELKPREYDRKDYQAHEFGFIAEEMALIYPEVVGYDTNGVPSGIDYGKLSTILTAKIQEQQKTIEKLQAQMTQVLGFLKGTK